MLTTMNFSHHRSFSSSKNLEYSSFSLNTQYMPTELQVAKPQSHTQLPIAVSQFMMLKLGAISPILGSALMFLR